MVLQFVGFMAAYRAPGALSPMLAGTLGGLLATWVTFTPCFLWIFLGAPFIETLRQLMADFRSPFVPDLPRLTGGAVGYLGYGAASWFEPVLGDLGGGADGSDQAGFMLFDTVLAFDHVQHVLRYVLRADDEPPQQRAAQDGRLWEALGLHEARVDGVHVDAERPELERRRA